MRKFLFVVFAIGLIGLVAVDSGVRADSATATIVVNVPADARIFFDGAPTTQSGAQRIYTTPALATPGTYVYQLKAEATREGRVVSRTKRVVVKPGEKTEVNFGDLSGSQEAGHLYTINNDAQRNGIVVLERREDGSLAEVPGSPFATEGKGLTGGDIDEQGASASRAIWWWPSTRAAAASRCCARNPGAG